VLNSFARTVVEKHDGLWQNKQLCIDMLHRYIGSGYPRILLTGHICQLASTRRVSRAEAITQPQVEGARRILHGLQVAELADHPRLTVDDV
jgi:hypothetical protein